LVGGILVGGILVGGILVGGILVGASLAIAFLFVFGRIHGVNNVSVASGIGVAMF
jgi:hypothetical protein